VGWAQWIRTVEVEPAIDAGAAALRERDIEALLRSGCRVVHVNAKDGNAVEALGLLAPLVHRYGGVLDVHVASGDFARLAAAGADSVTFDAVDAADVPGTIERAHAAGLQAGVAFGTETDAVRAVADAADADLVLCEGEFSLSQVRELSRVLPLTTTLQVEGDVSHDNIRLLYGAGARLFVADRPIFEREDVPRAYRRLVDALA
jgi:pentose-5-phosphate-3-epimerase